MGASHIKFGTDGWRAGTADEYTFDAVRVCAQAVAEWVQKSGEAERGVVIGFDRRFRSEHFAAAAAEVVAAHGIHSFLASAASPTQSFSYATMRKKAKAGIVITASHNPWTDNGFKVKEETGSAASPAPIPPNIDEFLTRMPKERADVGLGVDGDADRAGLADEKGTFVTTLTTYALLMWYLLEVRKLRKPVVKTVNMTSMIDRLGEKYGVPVYEVPVGFKYIGPKMQETGAMMGGEESGGFGFAMHLPERDGIVADLFFLDFMLKTKKKPSQLIAELMDMVGPSYYLRRDLHFSADAYASAKGRIMAALQEAAPEQLGGHAVAKIVQLDTKDGTKFFLDDGSWLLMRLSGTEPLVRVYAETKAQDELAPLLDAGEKMVRGA